MKGYNLGMADEIAVEGKQYISSKRASELTSYAQDYIGQLARKGLIEAKRIGGLWYISRESLTEYKQRADEYKPEPPRRDESRVRQDLDSVISLDGKDYISAPRAAEITGYHQDYVGQLARTGKILSRQVGNRWYVERSGITAHKKEKDALLAAVQAEAVGIVRVDSSDTHTLPQEPFFTYTNESSAPFPLSSKVQEAGEHNFSIQEESVETEHKVPIRVMESNSSTVVRKVPAPEVARGVPQAHMNRWSTLFTRLGLVSATIVVVVSVGYISFQKKDVLYALIGKDAAPALAVEASGVFSRMGDLLESWLTSEIVYNRSF